MIAPPVYLDHHATTPVDPRVAQVVLDAMTTHFGNANSAQHVFGLVAARMIRDAAGLVAALVGSDADDVQFTSSATEALRLALAYAAERRPGGPLRVFASPIEHPALLDDLERGTREGRLVVQWASVDQDGLVLVPTIREALRQGVDLVCLMAANNEVGAIQPVEIRRSAGRRGRRGNARGCKPGCG